MESYNRQLFIIDDNEVYILIDAEQLVCLQDSFCKQILFFLILAVIWFLIVIFHNS